MSSSSRRRSRHRWSIPEWISNGCASAMRFRSSHCVCLQREKWNDVASDAASRPDRSPSCQHIRLRESSSIALLGDLHEGTIFARKSAQMHRKRERSRVDVPCRYVIESAPLAETPNSRCAVNAITGERVYLQFFPDMQNEFENSIRMHNALSESQFICRYPAHPHP